ncbi:MAG: S1 RNA-binding domain-containing protein [Clostridia bacterium]|nr:S1 RNA-binding domain-containing protein [Clostridia bacterium]MBQ2940103.1 S1 RNA-binding domain-containing protein [Clostridia bacterium]
MQFEVGSIVEGKVTSITNFGAFVELPENATGMVHISEVASTYVREIREFLTEGQTVKVKVINIAPDGKIALSIKKAAEAPARRQPRQPAPVSHRPGDFEWRPTKNASSDFEDMMSKFKATSDEKISDLKRSHDGRYGGFSRGRGNRGNQDL